MFPSDWSSGLLVFCQCSNSRRLQALTSQHLRWAGPPLTLRVSHNSPASTPAAIGFRGCPSALCPPIIAISSSDWLSYSQSGRVMDPSRGARRRGTRGGVVVAGGGSGGGDSDASQPVSGRGGRAAAQASEFRARHGPVMGPGAGVEEVGSDRVTGARRGPSPPPSPSV